VTFEAGHCPSCGLLREATLTHLITGDETFLHKSLASVGVPALHIIRAHNGVEYRFYELSGDLPSALHFRHFESSIKLNNDTTPRIRIKDKIHLKEEKIRIGEKDAPLVIKPRGRVRLRD